MPTLTPEPLDPLTFGESQLCYGCGPTHPTGFHMQFSRVGEDEVVTTFVPGEFHQGPPGIMHGGLVTTLADELAAWVLVAVLGKFGFTAALQCKFHQPIRIGVPVEGRARIVRNGARIVVVEATLSQSEKLSYKGDFTFALFDRAGAERVLQGPLPKEWERFTR